MRSSPLLGIPRLSRGGEQDGPGRLRRAGLRRIATELREFAARLGPIDLRLVPVASRDGINLVTREQR